MSILTHDAYMIEGPVSLPCHPCPHHGACCADGVSLRQQEANEIRLRFGARHLVWNEEDKEWRTARYNGRCIFQWQNGDCAIHDTAVYPSLCAAFPMHGFDGGPYLGDAAASCPEMRKP